MSVYKAKIKFNRLGPDEYEIEIDDEQFDDAKSTIEPTEKEVDES